MEYIEALAIKRYVRPDNLPGHMAHLPEEADRVIKLHQAICQSGDTPLPLLLPTLSPCERQRVNAILVYRLAQECGLFELWGGQLKPLPVRKGSDSDIALASASEKVVGKSRTRPARPGGSARVLDHLP